MKWSIEAGRAKRAKYGDAARPWTAAEDELIRSEPKLDAGGWLLRRAYGELATCRSLGMCVGPIPWTAINDWCKAKGYVGGARAHLEAVILTVDADYVRRANEPKK